MLLLKGCQKKIIRLESRDSRLFDEAFFVLRDDVPTPATGDMVAEANRILEENMLTPKRRRHAAFLSWVVRAAFFLAGGVATAAILLLCLLF